MAEKNELQWLAGALERGRKAARFCVNGQLDISDPGLTVEGVGAINLPLKARQARDLIAVSQRAPYGKGTETRIDPRVRKTWEVDAARLQCRPDWDAAIAAAAESIATQLGLPADSLIAEPYKLLLYEVGGMFLPHRDSEKLDGMVASLIVVLPTFFEGGQLKVEHNDDRKRFDFKSATEEKSAEYVAFYADCEHAVEKVTRGRRLALAYNLVLKPQTGRSRKPKASPSEVLSHALRTWASTNPGEPLMFALEHLYTPKSLSLKLLKGHDRALADAVVAAAEETDGIVHLAQVERHVNQHADDGYYGYDRYRRSRYRYDDEEDYEDEDGDDDDYSRRGRSAASRKRELELGEVYEDELSASGWKTLSGKSQSFGNISLSIEAIISSTPLEDWKPTREEYEGYTGNAGNTLDRWYHRSVLVVWLREQHYRVLASAGLDAVLPQYLSQWKKLKKTAKKRAAEATSDVVQFARAIIGAWPKRYGFESPRRWGAGDDPALPVMEFIETLLPLQDLATMLDFLRVVGERDRSRPVSELVLQTGWEFGWGSLSDTLVGMVSQPKDPYSRDDGPIATRDLSWFRAICRERKDDAERQALIDRLAVIFTQLFCQPPARDVRRYYDSDEEPEATTCESNLLPLLEALLAGKRDDDLEQVVAFTRAQPNLFRRELCQVPTLNKFIPQARKRTAGSSPAVEDWLEEVRRQLTDATAKEPVTPCDWSRPVVAKCTCRFCQELSGFLSDPLREVGEIVAGEGDRNHLTQQIHREKLDVVHKLVKQGRPYRLLLTKTNGSYERQHRRYLADCQLLESLP
ncbi:MAG: 2OG-Fe(II) oxygenase, partial [Planctomycetaceae bacterium]